MKRLLSVLIASSISVGSSATTLYKTTDEQGNVSYSDSPPVDTSRTSEISVSDKELNVLPSEGIEQQMREQKVKDSQDANRRRAEQQSWQQRYDQAKAELDQAKLNLQRAEEIQEGDTVGSAFGGARPNVEWIERLEQAEADLAQKQRAFDKIKRQPH